MRKSDLQFIQDTMVMQKLFHEPSLHKNAQDGVAEVMSGVKSHVAKLYDPQNPVESVLAFIGPGLLWMLGFKWVAVLYELAAALGFDWTHFFSSIKEKMRPLLEDLVAGKSQDSSAINNIVQDSAMGAFGENSDPVKLEEVVNKYQSVNSLLFMKKIAQLHKSSDLKETIEKMLSGITGKKMRKGILGFIIRVMSWILSAVIIACGFNLIGGVAKKILKIDQKDSTTELQADNSTGNVKPVSNTKKNNVVLQLNPNADQSFSTTTYNDNNHVWLLNMNVGNIKSQMIEWAQELYPQLSNVNAFNSSPSFNRALRMFQERNKEAAQLEIVAVPQPFKSIREIVDSFAADVAAHMS